MKDDRLYLIHISECIDRVEKYTVEGEAAFHADSKTQDAVIRSLQIMAESTQKISQPLKLRHPEVPWRSISFFRNITVHDYLGIDARLIWHIVEFDLPKFKSKIKEILEEMGSSTQSTP